MLTIYLLLTSIIMLSGINNVLEKKFQLSVKNNLPTMLMLNLVNGVFGCVYFLFLCKFNVQMNFTTFAFSFGYAMIVFNSLVISVVALSRLSIPAKTIVGMLGSVLGSTFFGKIFFDETITLNSWLAIIFLLAAVIIPNINSPESKSGKSSFFVCVWLFVSFAISSVYLKFYIENPKSLAANNMFFMTNLICLIICAIVVIIYVIAKKQYRKSILTTFGVKRLTNIGFRTAISNISSIISVFVIAAMDISVYTVLTSSISLVASAMISKFVFYEDLSRKNYVSILLAVASIVVSAL